MKASIFMIVNNHGEFYRNFEKRSSNVSSYWTSDQRRATIWFEKRHALCAVKHIKVKGNLKFIKIVYREIELPTEDDVLQTINFENLK